MCRVSVVIPLYNKRDSILNTLNCVLNQTFQDFEVIVVDDGSTDDGALLVEKLQNHKIHLIRQKNGGVSAARNKGIECASGEFIALLDADDEWECDYLAVQNSLVEKYHDCDVFVTNYEFRKPNGEKESAIINKLKFEDDGVMDNYFEVAGCSHPPITSITIMMKKKSIQSIGGFPLNIKSGEDLITWAKLALNGKIAFTTKICATYNLGEGYDYSKLPPRRQDIGDPVGVELKKLYSSNMDVVGLKHYIAHWHKMRSSVALRYGERMETINEALKCLKYHPSNFKVLPFIILALLPTSMRNSIIKKIKG